MRSSSLRAVFTLLAALPAPAQDFGPWHVLGRLPAEFDKGSTTAVLGPERTFKKLGPGGEGPDLTADFEGYPKERVAWRRLTGDAGRSELDVGVLDLNVLCPPPESRKGELADAAVYLYRRIDAPSAREITVTLGSDDGVKLWFNGQVLLERHVARALAAQDDRLTLALAAGVNHLLVKVTQKDGAFAFRLRAPQRIEQSEINAAIDKGVKYLIQRQLIDGSWGVWEEWGGGHAAFVAYTLLKCGVRPDHPAVRMAMEFTRQRAMDTTYALSCLILALEAHGQIRDRDRMQDALAQLLDVQTTNGLWDYPVYPHGDRPPADMSNTLYAALALRAAKKSGFDVPDSAWIKMAGGAMRCFDERAAGSAATKSDAASGFSYRTDGGTTGSTTTAGISVLAICDQLCGERLPAPLRVRTAQVQEISLRWLHRNLEWSNNPGAGVGHHYFWIYGIERVGALLALERIGGVEWYWEGAEYLVRAQNENGAWNPHNYVGHDRLDTCLALLFLERATAPTSGGRTARADLYETTAQDAQLKLRASGDTPLAIWVSDVSASVLESLGANAASELELERIDYLARFHAEAGGERVIGTVPCGRVKSTDLQRFALRHPFERRGKWLLRARLHFWTNTDGTARSAKVVETPELAVEIDGVLAPERLTYAADLGRNLLSGAKLRAEASSQNGDGDAPAKCADGSFGTQWRCAKDEERSWVRIVLDRPTKANALALSHASPRISDAADARATRIDVLVNRTERFAATMADDVLEKTRVAFGADLLVKELEVRVLECRDRKLGEHAVGFSEIELFRIR